MFKSKFEGWDDLIAVDYTRSAEVFLSLPFRCATLYPYSVHVLMLLDFRW